MRAHHQPKDAAASVRTVDRPQERAPAGRVPARVPHSDAGESPLTAPPMSAVTMPGGRVQRAPARPVATAAGTGDRSRIRPAGPPPLITSAPGTSSPRIRRRVAVTTPQADGAEVWALLGRTRPDDADIEKDPEAALIEHMVTSPTEPFRFATRADLEAFIARYKEFFGPGKGGLPKPGLAHSNAVETYRAPITTVTAGALDVGYSYLTRVIVVNGGTPNEIKIRCYLSHKRHLFDTMTGDLATPIASKLVNVVVADAERLKTSMNAYVDAVVERLKTRAMLLGFDPSAVPATAPPVSVNASTNRQPQPPEAPGDWQTEIHAQPVAGDGAFEFSQDEFAQLSLFVRALYGADHDRMMRTSTPWPMRDVKQKEKASTELTALKKERINLSKSPFDLLDTDDAAQAAGKIAARMQPAVDMRLLVPLAKLVARCLKPLKWRGVVPEVDPGHAKLAPTHNEAQAIWAGWGPVVQGRVTDLFAAAGQAAKLATFATTPAVTPEPAGLVAQLNAAKSARAADDELDITTIRNSGWQASDTAKLTRFLAALDAQFPGQARSASDAVGAAAHWS
jgi:hypothetical protein